MHNLSWLLYAQTPPLVASRLNTRHSRVTPASVIISSTYMHYLLLLAQSSSSSTILKTHETASSLHLGISPTPDLSSTSQCQLPMVMAPLWPPLHPVQDHRNPIPPHEVLMEVIPDIRAWFWGNSCSVSLSVQLKTRHVRFDGREWKRDSTMTRETQHLLICRITEESCRRLQRRSSGRRQYPRMADCNYGVCSSLVQWDGREKKLSIFLLSSQIRSPRITYYSLTINTYLQYDRPADTLYEGAILRARLIFPEVSLTPPPGCVADVQEYPLQPPKMIFDSEMWHPNVYSTSDKKGEVCISILVSCRLFMIGKWADE